MSPLSEVEARTGKLARPGFALLLPLGVTGLHADPRVLQLRNADAVSWGLPDSFTARRATDLQAKQLLDVVQATARSLDPRARIRYAAVPKTAAHHLNVLTASGNGTWSIRCRLDGADEVLLEELNALEGGASCAL